MNETLERFSLYADTATQDAAEKRRAAAMELIHAEALGGAANPRALESNINNLTNYADLIQKALRVK